MTQIANGGRAKPSRFEALDAWRGICALLVAVLHAPFADPLRDAPWLDNVQFCVDLFFVLSGFVLMHAYGARLATGADLGRFVIVRLGRLWPLHVAVLSVFVGIELARLLAVRHGGLAFVLPPFGPGRSPGDILDNLLMLQAIGPTGRLSWNFPAWSIAVEFWSALVLAALVWLVGPRRPGPLLALALASGIALHAVSPASPLVIERWGLLRCLCDVAVGALVLILRDRLRATPGPVAGSAIELLVLALAASFVALVRPGPAGFAAPLLCGSFVLVFSRESGAVSRLLAVRPFQALGRWSFSIYMLHVLVFELVRSAAHLLETRTGHVLLVPQGDGLLVTIGSPALDLAANAVTIALVVVPLAALSYRFVERPALAAARRIAVATVRSAPEPRLTASGALP